MLIWCDASFRPLKEDGGKAEAETKMKAEVEQSAGEVGVDEGWGRAKCGRGRGGAWGGGTEINSSSTWYNRKIICIATYLNASGRNVLLLGQLKSAVLFHGWLKCALLLWLSDGLLARSDSAGETPNSTISMLSSASLALGQLYVGTSDTQPCTWPFHDPKLCLYWWHIALHLHFPWTKNYIYINIGVTDLQSHFS